MARFGELEDAAGRLAGYHTGVSVHVHSDHLSQPIVRFHEDVHDRVFHETADGLLHHLLLLYAKRASDPQGIRLAVDATDRLLWETRQAHEAAATYLGVQSILSPGGKAEAMGHLTPEYQEYYQLFERVVGGLSTSSVCLYEIGWACTVWMFGSGRATRLHSLTDLAAGGIWSVDGPAERLQFLLAAAASKERSGLARSFEADARAAFARDGVAWFPIGEDDEWIARAEDPKGRRANRLVAECAVRLVSRLCPEGAAVTRFEVPEFLREMAASLNLYHPTMDLWGKRGLDIPGRAARTMASDADRYRIARTAVPLDVLTELQCGPDLMGTDRRLEMFLVVRERSGKPVVLLWASELDGAETGL